LTAVLPQLVNSIERAERMKQERIEREIAKTERAERVKKAEEAAKVLKSSRKRRDVGEKKELAAPGLERKDSDASSEMTMIEPSQVEPIHQSRKKGVKFVDEDDRRSLSSVDSTDSVDSMDERYVV
jgi:hypothetical protein